MKGKGFSIQEDESTKLTKRTLDLPSWAMIMLERRLKNLTDSGVEVASLLDLPVFPAQMGGLRDPSNTQADLGQAFDFGGFTWLTSHTLRKTVASLMDDAGASARAVADQLGHSQPSMSQNKYMGRKSTGAAVVLEAIGA